MFYLFLFIFGTAIGSFLNVLIDRLPNEKSIMGRSHCDICDHKLSGFDLIPIVSFILLGARCRYCSKKISWQYPLVEGLTGILFVMIMIWEFPIFNIQFPISNIQIPISNSILGKVILLGLISCLIVIFFSDAKYQIIPDSMQAALFIFSFLIIISKNGNLIGLIGQLGSSLLIMLPILLIYFFSKGKAMGFGDVKLSFTIGFLLGIKSGFLALYLAFIIGGLFGLILILTGQKKLKSKIAFGPFLVLGLLTILFWHRQINLLINKIYGI